MRPSDDNSGADIFEPKEEEQIPNDEQEDWDPFGDGAPDDDVFDDAGTQAPFLPDYYPDHYR